LQRIRGRRFLSHAPHRRTWQTFCPAPPDKSLAIAYYLTALVRDGASLLRNVTVLCQMIASRCLGSAREVRAPEQLLCRKDCGDFALEGVREMPFPPAIYDAARNRTSERNTLLGRYSKQAGSSGASIQKNAGARNQDVRSGCGRTAT
jgi:hypothetical protein